MRWLHGRADHLGQQTVTVTHVTVTQVWSVWTVALCYFMTKQYIISIDPSIEVDIVAISLFCHPMLSIIFYSRGSYSYSSEDGLF